MLLGEVAYPAVGGTSPKAMGGLAEKIHTMYYVYVIQSVVTSRYYIGSAQNIPKRLQEHNRGKMKSTKHGAPWKVVYTEVVKNRSLGFGREQQIKRYKSGEAFHKLIRGEVA